MKDLLTVTIICEELLKKGYVDATKEILKDVNKELLENQRGEFTPFKEVNS